MQEPTCINRLFNFQNNPVSKILVALYTEKNSRFVGYAKQFTYYNTPYFSVVSLSVASVILRSTAVQKYK